VVVRFDFSAAESDYNGWQLDDVAVGTRACDADSGGLLVGRVLDANTGRGVDRADLTSVDAPADTAASAADPQQGAGFYELFSSLTGQRPVQVSAEDYVTTTQAIDIAAGSVTSADISLKAGRLAVTPGTLTPRAVLGGGATTTFTVTNTGTAPATLATSQQPGLTSSMTTLARSARGTFPAQRVRLTPRQRAVLWSSGPAPRRSASPAARRATLPAPTARASAAASAGPSWADITGYPFGIMTSAVVRGGDGKIYSFGGYQIQFGDFVPTGIAGTTSASSFVYDPSTGAWSPVADMPVPVWAAAAGFIDGKVVIAGGFTDTGTTSAVQIYDPATNRWTFGPDMPQARAAGAAAVFDGKLFVVGGRLCTWIAGCPQVPWSSSVYAYDPTASRWSAPAAYPLQVLEGSCGGFDGQDELVCAGGENGSAGVTAGQAYAYHPESNSWTPVASMPLATASSSYAVANNELVISSGIINSGYYVSNGYAYDPATNSWSTLPDAPYPLFGAGAACGFYRVGGVAINLPYSLASQLSGFGQCTGQPASIPWLTSGPTSLTLQPGQSATVTVHTTASQPAVTQPGTYRAGLALQTDTPYSMPAVQVAFTVTPPAGWGKITGTVTGLDCNGTATPLAGSTVEVTTSAGGSYALTTDANGNYGYWLDASDSPLTLIAFNAGYLSQTRTARITAGAATTANFTLKPAQSCP
jgi:N-acetylneuraminic acid mutarotase